MWKWRGRGVNLKIWKFEDLKIGSAVADENSIHQIPNKIKRD